MSKLQIDTVMLASICNQLTDCPLSKLFPKGSCPFPDCHEVIPEDWNGLFFSLPDGVTQIINHDS